MKFYTLLSWLLAGFLLSTPGRTAEADAPTTLPDIVDTVASGVGRDKDEATHDALVNAVRQAIGSVVSAETLVQNDQVVRDQILTYSSGFVEKYELIGKPRTTAGSLVQVSVSVRIQRVKLVEKIRSAKIAMRPIDGNNIANVARSHEENRVAAEEVVAKELDDIPRGLIKAEIAGERNFNEGTEQLHVPVRVSLDTDAYASLLKRIQPALEVAAVDSAQLRSVRHRNVKNSRTEGPDLVGTIYFADKAFPKLRPDVDGRGTKCLFLCESLNEQRTSSQWRAYSLRKRLFDKFESHLTTVVIVVALLDTEGKSVDSHEIQIGPSRQVLGPLSHTREVGAGAPEDCIAIQPLLVVKYGSPADLPTFHYEDGQAWGYRLSGCGVARNYDVKFDLKPPELKRVAKAICRVEMGK